MSSALTHQCYVRQTSRPAEPLAPHVEQPPAPRPEPPVSARPQQRHPHLSLKKTKKRIRKRTEKPVERKYAVRRRTSGNAVPPESPPSVGPRNDRHDRGCGTSRTPDSQSVDASSESNKLLAKILKVTNYWRGRTVLIPNTFRITCYLEDDDTHVLEYQDLSKKEVLAQFNSKQSASFEPEEMSDSGRAVRPRDALRRGSVAARTPHFK